jgi:DNA-binding MarR family transcriptional regulator
MKNLSRKPERRIWLRLVTCTTIMENEIRRRLRERFSFTLPRFDLLALLDHSEEGISLGQASRAMLVSAPNITPIVQKLAEDGYIARFTDKDRRKQIIRITSTGRLIFHEMQRAHSKWIDELLSGLLPDDVKCLNGALGRLEKSVKARRLPVE